MSLTTEVIDLPEHDGFGDAVPTSPPRRCAATTSRTGTPSPTQGFTNSPAPVAQHRATG